MADGDSSNSFLVAARWDGKVCTKCKKFKEFASFARYGERRRGRFYRRAACKICENEQKRRYDESPKGKRARDRAKGKNGLSIEGYEVMLTSQGGVCFLCKRPECAKAKSGHIRRMAVDHDHKTGRIRGLLCYRCNILLGWLEHNDMLQAVQGYIAG